MSAKAIWNWVRDFFYLTAKITGAGAAGVRILCYHRVNSLMKNYLTVSNENFREQMSWLADQGYKTISLSDLLAGNLAGERSVVITFDDGYEDNYRNAFPAMRPYGFTGTVFAVAGCIEAKDYLSVPQIREMAGAGFTFGAHTVNHVHLKMISSEAKRREIFQSKELVAKASGRPCESFCYPYGEYDRESVQLVSEAGFSSACSNIPGANRKITNPFLLKRTEISGGDTLDDFSKKIAGACDLLHAGLHLIRRRA